MSQTEEQLIHKYSGLVRSQALRLFARLPANVELDDLMQVGLIGLLDAIRRYQEQDNAQFETYAITRIRGAMLDELRSQDWLSRNARQKARLIESTIQKLRHQLGREPFEEELAKALQLSLDEYRKMLQEVSGTQVVHAEDLFRHHQEKGADPLEVLGATQIKVSQQLRQPEQQLQTQALRQCLIEAIEQLPEREQLLLSLQFEQDLNQKEIAVVMEVSEGRISQLRSQAISRIRAYLKANHWEQQSEDIDLETLF